MSRSGLAALGLALALPFLGLGCVAGGAGAVVGECKPVATAPEGGAPEGRALVEQECGKCHSLNPGAPSLKLGPNIALSFGRRAGQRQDFPRYSEAMRTAAAKGLVWDETTLDAYIADPGAFLKSFSGRPEAKHGMFFKMPDGNKRKRVVTYLKSMTSCQETAPPS